MKHPHVKFVSLLGLSFSAFLQGVWSATAQPVVLRIRKPVTPHGLRLGTRESGIPEDHPERRLRILEPQHTSSFTHPV